MDKIDELVLETLSFYEPMTFANIILDFNDELLAGFPDFDKEQLVQVLSHLEQKKLIKKVMQEKEVAWIRVFRKRSWWKRLFPL